MTFKFKVLQVRKRCAFCTLADHRLGCGYHHSFVRVSHPMLIPRHLHHAQADLIVPSGVGHMQLHALVLEILLEIKVKMPAKWAYIYSPTGPRTVATSAICFTSKAPNMMGT